MSVESALALIESVKDYRVLFVGDRIVDEYHYVQQLGKSPKEYVIPLKYLEKEVFAGGVEAAANHARSFCANVTVAGGIQITKKVRFVDKNDIRKLCEVHYSEICDAPTDFVGALDALVITDFGHGAVDTVLAQRYSSGNTFTAVNAQTNSANIGFNLITKYPHAGYVVIDEPEARLAAADRDGHIEDVVHKLAHGRCERFVVTRGKFGSVGYDHGRFFIAPTYSGIPLDTLGAGDAFLAVTAPMAKHGSMEDLLLIGNAAGALKTQIVGHRASITKEALIEFIKASG